MKYLFRLLASVFVVGALFTVFSSAVAFADTTCASVHKDQYCTGRDPITQGCSADAYTVPGGIYYITDNNGHNIGEAQLRYSSTCQSNWARVVVYNSCPYINIFANVKRPDQIYQGTEYVAAQEPYTISNPGCVSNFTMYTDMVFAPGTVQAQACGSIEGYYGGGCTKLI